VCVVHRRRVPDGRWSIATASGLDPSIELPSIGFKLHLGDLYGKVVKAK
jgi:hypothetical protein